MIISHCEKVPYTKSLPGRMMLKTCLYLNNEKNNFMNTNNIHDFMPLPGERIYTIDDIYALPDGERAELINGSLTGWPPSITKDNLYYEYNN